MIGRILHLYQIALKKLTLSECMDILSSRMEKMLYCRILWRNFIQTWLEEASTMGALYKE